MPVHKNKLYTYTLDGRTYGLGHVRTMLEHKKIKPGTILIRSDGTHIEIITDPAGDLRMIKKSENQ